MVFIGQVPTIRAIARNSEEKTKTEIYSNNMLTKWKNMHIIK